MIEKSIAKLYNNILSCGKVMCTLEVLRKPQTSQVKSSHMAVKCNFIERVSVIQVAAGFGP